MSVVKTIKVENSADITIWEKLYYLKERIEIITEDRNYFITFLKEIVKNEKIDLSAYFKHAKELLQLDIKLYQLNNIVNTITTGGIQDFAIPNKPIGRMHISNIRFVASNSLEQMEEQYFGIVLYDHEEMKVFHLQKYRTLSGMLNLTCDKTISLPFFVKLQPLTISLAYVGVHKKTPRSYICPQFICTYNVDPWDSNMCNKLKIYKEIEYVFPKGDLDVPHLKISIKTEEKLNFF